VSRPITPLSCVTPPTKLTGRTDGAYLPYPCSIKGNVKENICPSTGSEEPLLDFQPLPAMKDA